MSLFVYRSRRFNRFYGLILFLFAVWVSVGFVVVAADLRTPFGAWADFTFIALAALVLLLHFAGRQSGAVVCLVFFLYAFISGGVEALGAATGFPFGSYSYSGNFGPLLFGLLPLAIPLAWWVVVWPLHCLVHSALSGRGLVAWVPFVTAGLAVWADLVIEPAATLVRGYWTWEGGGIYYGVPWTNFAAWYATAFVLSFLSQVFLPHNPFKRAELRVPLLVLATTLFTFLLVSLVHGKWPVVLVALGLFGALWKLVRSARTQSLS